MSIPIKHLYDDRGLKRTCGQAIAAWWAHDYFHVTRAITTTQIIGLGEMIDVEFMRRLAMLTLESTPIKDDPVD